MFVEFTQNFDELFVESEKLLEQKTNDINDVLSNLNGLSPSYSFVSPYIPGFLNLQPINNIFTFF